MKIAVCDDEKVFHKEITELMKQYRKKKKVEVYLDYYQRGSELISSVHEYDVIFMDYQMEGLDGIETARKLRETNKDSIIIFISAYPAVALDSFEVNTFRFLTKPIDKNKLFKALDDYLMSIDYDNLLVLKTHEGVWKIKMSDIIYAEADGKHTCVRTANKTFDVHIHLKVIEAKLPRSKFFRCHRAFVVGFSHIINHTNDEILFDNGERADIGKHYAAAFKSAFQEYIMRYNEGSLL